DPLAALGTLGFVTAMYAGLSYTFPDLPRRWIGILLVLGAIFVNGLLTAFDMNWLRSSHDARRAPSCEPCSTGGVPFAAEVEVERIPASWARSRAHVQGWLCSPQV